VGRVFLVWDKIMDYLSNKSVYEFMLYLLI